MRLFLICVLLGAGFLRAQSHMPVEIYTTSWEAGSPQDKTLETRRYHAKGEISYACQLQFNSLTNRWDTLEILEQIFNEVGEIVSRNEKFFERGIKEYRTFNATGKVDSLVRYFLANDGTLLDQLLFTYAYRPNGQIVGQEMFLKRVGDLSYLPMEMVRFTYDGNDRLLSRTEHPWSISQNTWLEPIRSQTWTYNTGDVFDSVLEIHEHRRFVNTDWIRLYTQLNVFDKDGHEIEQIRQHERIALKEKRAYAVNGQLTERQIWQSADSLRRLENLEHIFYQYEGADTAVKTIYYSYDQASGTFRSIQELTWEYLDGNLARETTTYTYLNEENDTIRSSWNIVYDQGNFCDGSLAWHKKVERKYLRTHQETRYTYGHVPTCGEGAPRGELIVGPSPLLPGQPLFIKSSWLQYVGVKGRVLDASGRVVLDFLPNLGVEMHLSLPTLPAGVYVVQLFNEGESRRAKFLQLGP